MKPACQFHPSLLLILLWNEERQHVVVTGRVTSAADGIGLQGANVRVTDHG